MEAALKSLSLAASRAALELDDKRSAAQAWRNQRRLSAAPHQHRSSKNAEPAEVLRHACAALGVAKPEEVLPAIETLAAAVYAVRPVEHFAKKVMRLVGRDAQAPEARHLGPSGTLDELRRWAAERASLHEALERERVARQRFVRDELLLARARSAGESATAAETARAEIDDAAAALALALGLEAGTSLSECVAQVEADVPLLATLLASRVDHLDKEVRAGARVVGIGGTPVAAAAGESPALLAKARARIKRLGSSGRLPPQTTDSEMASADSAPDSGAPRAVAARRRHPGQQPQTQPLPQPQRESRKQPPSSLRPQPSTILDDASSKELLRRLGARDGPSALRALSEMEMLANNFASYLRKEQRGVV